MISIYAPEAQDFSTLGLGALAPYECVIEEQAGGMYELTMTHPMDAEGKWLNIGVGCIVKAPAPVRETPLAVEDEEGVIPSEPETVTRRIYRVRTNTGANLHLRQGPSTSTRILSKYRPGTEVVVLSQSGGWGQVIVRSSGASGYMSMQYLVWVRDEVETIEGDAPTPQRVVYPVQSRMQLFRIFKVERDAAEREVRVEARHIFYDLLGDPTDSEYAPEGVAAGTVVEQLFDRALDPHGFDVHCQLTGSVTGDYTRRGLVECLLDPDDGVLPQTNGRLIRDNFDIWLLPDLPRETGVTIRHGKNLLGATLTTDWEDLTTRIIPVGQNSDGKPLLLAGTIYVDSPRIDDYPVIRAQAVEYDVKVGQDGINNATQARAKLTELAEADFADNGVDLPTVGLDVDFVALGETEEYKKYADLEAVHLYDTVRVIAKEAGIDAAVRVTGYKWDALGRKYEAVTLGEIADLKPTVYGYELPRGSIKTIKIANGAVGSAQLRDLAVQYAHLGTAAIEQLSANSITALKAYITEIVAGSVTTDELYAGIASIALAQITTANIEKANIDWAQIGTLAADVAEIAKAHLGDADIDWAQIANLTAAVAEIAQVEIEEAVIDGAQITDGTITNAKIANATIDTAKIALGAITTALIDTGAVGTAQIADGSITSAKIVSLNADVITAGTLSVDRLLLKGANGLFVAINATDEGLTAEELSQATYQNAISGTVLVARSVTADKIAAKSITANEIAAGTITAAELAAESVDATKIQAGSITTSHVVAGFGQALDISSNQSIQLVVSNVTTAQNTANSAQSAANAAQSAADAAQSAADDAQDTADANASDLASYILSNNAEIENLQGQIDGAITTWFYEVAPSLNNPPANGWTTTEDKNVHLGDLYYDTITGYCYRWQVQNNQYSWQRITDTDVTKALEDAASAQDTADAKRRVFVAQPVPPYDVGDLWAQGVGGDILRCQVAKTAQQSYAASDWARASKYTDDTAADAAQSAADAAQSTADSNTAAIGGLTTRVTQAETAIIQNAERIELRATKTEVQTVATAASNAQSAADAAQSAATGAQGTADAAQSAASAAQTAADNAASAAQTAQGAADAAQSTADAAQSAADSAQEGADFATPLTGAEPPEEAPAAGKLWIDEGQTPSVWRRWRGADVPTDREYEETVSGNADSPAFVSIDNAQGQLQEAELEVGCVAQQAGAGEPSPENIRAITGRESVEIVACGKNMATTQPVIVSTQEQIVIDFGRDVHFDAIVASFMAKNLTMRGAQAASIDLRLADGTHQYRTWWDFLINGQSIQPSGNPDGLAICTLNNVTFRQLVVYWMTDNYARIGEGSELSDFQLEVGSSPLAYEPYTPMGGGVITPSEPLYGLPDAEDTVEVEASGDVTVTRRTAVLELDGTEDWIRAPKNNHGYYYRLNVADIYQITTPVLPNIICSHYQKKNADAQWNDTDSYISQNYHANTRTQVLIYDANYAESDLASWKAYLAAQKAAGTPVTIVYELAVPETEALTAITPITPEAGPVNIWTDADALTATVSGSGWETVNDTSSIQDALANLDGDLASLINEVGLLNGEVGSIAQQIISPDGIKNIVFESSEYQAMANTVEVNANELSVTQATVTDINGRVETIEGTVRISGSNIDIGRSDSNVQLHLDNGGWSISEGGQETIYARQNRVVAPRFQTTSLIFGALAFNSSGGHFRLMKYGG